jgi:hypothetical protein
MSLVKPPGGSDSIAGPRAEPDAGQAGLAGGPGAPHYEASGAMGAAAAASASVPEVTTSAPAEMSRQTLSAAARTASPPVSPSNVGHGGVGVEDPEGMGLETDESGRRMSQRRRRPNMRIHDELEPSDREKAWGKGRGRRSKTTAAPPVPAPSTNGVRPRAPPLLAGQPHACGTSLQHPAARLGVLDDCGTVGLNVTGSLLEPH